MKADGSEATARRILNHYLNSVREQSGDAVEAVVLVGSLVTGSYVAGPGDIDQITIVRDTCPHETTERLLRCVEEAMNAFDRGVNLAPVIYRRCDLERPWNTEWDLQPATRHLVCVPEELLRMHDQGIVIYGEAGFLQAIPTPTRDEMILYHQRWRELSRRYESKLAGPPDLSLRLQVQVILSNAIWHYYYATGRTCFDKHAISTRLAEGVPGYRFQSVVEQAARIRMAGFPDVPEEMLQTIKQGCQELMAWNRRFGIYAADKLQG